MVSQRDATPVIARGVGRRDYTENVERSTQPFVTMTQRQDRFNFAGMWNLTTRTYPSSFVWPFFMPQEDGSWELEASTIVAHFFEIGISLTTNHLCVIGLIRYASEADYDASNIAERFPQLFGYGSAKVRYSKGIPTSEGSVYAILFSGWNESATVDTVIEVTGLLSNLTVPWMVP